MDYSFKMISGFKDHVTLKTVVIFFFLNNLFINNRIEFYFRQNKKTVLLNCNSISQYYFLLYF